MRVGPIKIIVPYAHHALILNWTVSKYKQDLSGHTMYFTDFTDWKLCLFSLFLSAFQLVNGLRFNHGLVI